MNWQQLVYFETLAKEEHYTKASVKLYITQPALSKAIQGLEAEVGVPLFEQKGRNVKLTRFGKIFNNHVRRAIQEIEQGIQTLHSMISISKGVINIGSIHSMMSAFVPQMIAGFLREYPEIKFFTRQQSTVESLNYLLDDTVDLAFSTEYDVALYPNIEQALVTIEEINIAVPQEHHLAEEKEIKFEQVAKEPFVHYNNTTGMVFALEKLLKQAGYDINQLNISCLATEGNSILGMVRAGLGIAFVIDTPNINPVGIKILKLSDMYLFRRMFMSWRKESYMAPVVQVFRNFVLNAAAQNQAQPIDN